VELKWDDLKIFLAVGRSGSLSSAGKTLKVDAATVGRRIIKLEEALKASLFMKSPSGYMLTDAGQRLLGHAERAEAAMRGAVEELAGHAGGLSGQIRLGAPDGSANFLLPQVCAAIVDENPDLEVQIVALPRVFNLSKREADMAIALSAPTAGRLSVQKLTDYHLHLAGSEEYFARHGEINSLEDLRGRRMVGYISDMIFDKELDYLSDFGVDHVTLASNSVSVQINWVRLGCGVGVVHDFAIPAFTGLRKVLVDQISIKRSFYLIRHQDDRRVERLNRFAAALSSGIRREVARLEGLT